MSGWHSEEKDNAEKKSKEGWGGLEDMSTTTILLCVESNTFREVLSLTDSIYIWDKLKSRY